MGLYSQLNSADDRTADTAPAAHPVGAEESPISPVKSAHRRSKSSHSNKPSTDNSDDDDDAGWDFEEEGIELMPTTTSSRSLTADREEEEEEGLGKHVDEDHDLHSAAAMVRRVSSDSLSLLVPPGFAAPLERIHPPADNSSTQVVPESDDPTMPAVRNLEAVTPSAAFH